MGDQAAERRIDEAGALLRAVAQYRVSVEEVIELRTEARALGRRLKEIPDQLALAETREAEARCALLAAARGVKNGQIAEDIEDEIIQASRQLAGDSDAVVGERPHLRGRASHR
jgi:hypothetical protein